MCGRFRLTERLSRSEKGRKWFPWYWDFESNSRKLGKDEQLTSLTDGCRDDSGLISSPGGSPSELSSDARHLTRSDGEQVEVLGTARSCSPPAMSSSLSHVPRIRTCTPSCSRLTTANSHSPPFMALLATQREISVSPPVLGQSVKVMSITEMGNDVSGGGPSVWRECAGEQIILG